MITKQELVDGIRFAGDRAAAIATYCKDWDHQLGHQWTTGDAFRHVAAVAGGASQIFPMLDAGVLNGFNTQAAADNNTQAIDGMKGKSRDEIIAAIKAGHATSADFVATLDAGDLEKVVKLGGYEMPKGEILAQVWIHHAMAHSYEASARWPLQ